MTTVLIVEDEAATNSLYASAVRSAGFIVVQATGYQQAIHYLQGVIPNVVLLDLTLRDGDGFAIIDYLKARQPFHGTHIIVISGSIRHREYLVRLGITDFLLKPVLPDSLCQFLKHLVEASRQTG